MRRALASLACVPLCLAMLPQAVRAGDFDSRGFGLDDFQRSATARVATPGRLLILYKSDFDALIDGVERRLSHAALTDLQSPTARPAPPVTGLEERTGLFIEAAPQLSNTELEVPEPLARLVRKFDPAARDARNRALGRNGEELIVNHEREHLARCGRDDLARKIRWVSEEDGDGAGYDIASFDAQGRERLIEVKTTVGHLTTPFFLTENERAFSAERPDAFRLMRVYDFVRTPRAFELAPPLDASLLVRPAVYRASFD